LLALLAGWFVGAASRYANDLTIEGELVPVVDGKGRTTV
jgi:hypothetical protein